MSKYTLELWEVLEYGYNLFNFEYDFYDETKKATLQENFTNHFLFHEIGSETVDRFITRLGVRWKEVIGKYSTMFQANEEMIANNEVLTNFKSESEIQFHDTPNGEVSVDNGNLTNVTKTNSKGYAGTTGVQLLKDYNQNFVDIQEEFFKEFSSLFMQVF